MDRHSSEAQNSGQQTEYIPHSGVSGIETPVNDYDNTTLPEAVERGLVEVPESVPTELSSPQTQTQESEKPTKKKLSLVAKIGAGAAGLLIAGGAALGISQLAGGQDSNNTPPEKDPNDNSQVEEEPAPVEEEPGTNNPENEPSGENLEIPAGLNAEDLASLIIEDRLTNWFNAGAEDRIYDDMYDANQSSDEYVAILSEENSMKTADALFIEGWEENLNLASLVNLSTAMNKDILHAYIGSERNDDPTVTEGYKTWMTVDSVTETVNDDSSRTIVISTSYHDNSDKNNIEKFTGDGKDTWTFTLTADGDVEKISDAPHQ